MSVSHTSRHFGVSQCWPCLFFGEVGGEPYLEVHGYLFSLLT